MEFSSFTFLIFCAIFTHNAAEMMNPSKSENEVIHLKQNTLQKQEILSSFWKDLQKMRVMERNRRSDINSSSLVNLRSYNESVEGNKSLDFLSPENDRNMCLKALRDGFILIVATIAVYILICFVVFLFVLWLSKRSSRDGHLNFVGASNTSENSVLIQTPTTLMSHR